MECHDGELLESYVACPPTLLPSDCCEGVVCPAATSSCKVAGTCREDNGKCWPETNAPDGTPCDDGDEETVCTCWGGGCACRGRCEGVVCGPATGACKVAGSCQDSDGQCTAETNALDGTPCDDGDASTVADSCFQGRCIGGNVTCTGNADPLRYPDIICDGSEGYGLTRPKPNSDSIVARSQACCCECENVLVPGAEGVQAQALDGNTDGTLFIFAWRCRCAGRALFLTGAGAAQGPRTGLKLTASKRRIRTDSPTTNAPTS